MDTSGDTESGIERNKVLDQGLLQQLLECDKVRHMEKTRLLKVVGDAEATSKPNAISTNFHRGRDRGFTSDPKSDGNAELIWCIGSIETTAREGDPKQME